MATKILTDYLLASAKRFPDKTAFVTEARTTTFSEIQEEAEKVGTTLLQKGLLRRPVAILMDKCVECIHALLGTGMSGNFYTVLDASMPSARIEKILDTLQPAILITDEAHQEQAASFVGSQEILLYSRMMETVADPEALRLRRDDLLPTDIAYVLFTSGSTGVPKGVITSHQAVIAYLEWGVEALHLDETMVLANQTPFYFVMSTFDIYQTLRTGGTTHIIPKMYYAFPMMLMEYLKENHCNLLNFVPSVLIIAANLGVLSEIHLDDVRLVLFGGEVMPVRQLNMWRKEYPDADFYNIYGATETTDWGTYFKIDRDIPENESIPLGRSCNNLNVFLLNDQDEPAGPDELGEICVKGPSLAYGYYKDPEKTARVFVQNPLQKAYREIVYRTGDLGRFNERGEMVYAGRKDFQIKHMGHRIELGEIETAAGALSGIDRCCCLYNAEKDRIILFYTGSGDKKELKDALKTHLPEYMIPSRLHQLDQMPSNLNGKIDREALKKKL